MKLRIATRQSQLALAQTKMVSQLILAHFPDWTIELVAMTTEGDRKKDGVLSNIGGKGLFIKELEQALLAKTADLAVHSMKDLPAILDERFCLPAVLERADPRDALLSEKYLNLMDLPQGGRVGTASLRRQAQLKRWRPDLQTILLRGNVPTRLEKLKEYDAIILAAAGLERLKMHTAIKEYFSIENFLPSPGQGVIGIECLAENTDLRAALNALNHLPSFEAVMAERRVAHQLQASCYLPIGIYGEYLEDQACLKAMVLNAEGSQVVEAGLQASSFQDLPDQLVGLLQAQGVQDILDQFP